MSNSPNSNRSKTPSKRSAMPHTTPPTALSTPRFPPPRPYRVTKFESCYKAILESALEGYMSSGATSWKYPPEGIALARRMLEHADKHLLFLHDLSVPFENNGSERLLRKAKGKMKQSGGFRSTPNGEQPYCDFLTIVETAKMRGIQPYRAVHATFAGEGGLFA